MAWTTPINWLAKAVGYKVTRADLQTISDSLDILGSAHGLEGIYDSYYGGWVYDAGSTWVYQSANTIRVTTTGIPTFRYGVGTKLYWIQGGAPYFAYVTNCSLVSGTTWDLTLVGDAVLNSAISYQAYSYSNATEFPGSFAHTPAVTGWAAGATIDCDFSINGREMTYYYSISGTSNATSASLALPVAAAIQIRGALSYAQNNGSFVNAGVFAAVAAGSASLILANNGSGTGWTSSGTKSAVGQIVIPI